MRGLLIALGALGMVMYSGTPLIQSHILINGRNIKIAEPVITPGGSLEVVVPWTCGRNGIKPGDFVIIELMVQKTVTPPQLDAGGFMPGGDFGICQDGVAVLPFTAVSGELIFWTIRVEDKFKAPSYSWKVVQRQGFLVVP